jgi:hemerythrin-like domain-containing protein
MEFIAGLRDDHELIERVAGAFLTFAGTLPSNPRAAEDGARFVRFFNDFAGHFHHAREEDTLFRALHEGAGLPEEGPISALTADHRHLAQLLESARRLDAAAIREYVHGLWRHIDAENSVLLPEGEARLRKHGIRELSGRQPTVAELGARDEGCALLALYPPTLDEAAALRGDGCVCCPMMTVSCSGLEQAWWSEHEWEEFHDHLAGD